MSDDVNVRVMVRFRPESEPERRNPVAEGRSLNIDFYPDRKTVGFKVEADEKRDWRDQPKADDDEVDLNTAQTFTLDAVFDSSTSQQEVFETLAKKSVDDVLQGFNGTIFAYGQTGSGKTHSIFGSDAHSEQRGILPRSTAYMFACLEKLAEDGRQFAVKVSMLEIYKEVIYDLLQYEYGTGGTQQMGTMGGPKSARGSMGGSSSGPAVLGATPAEKEKASRAVAIVKIRDTPTGAVQVLGVTEPYVNSAADVFTLLESANKYRVVAPTAMNSVSSRSHVLVTLTVTQKLPDGSTRRGKLNIADLAGSERVGKSELKNTTLQEAKKINLSLSSLSHCINALTTGQGHIPFRNSKLTHLLKDSLGGNTKTTLLVCCSPHIMNAEESLTTLKFAQRAKRIKTSVKINQELSKKELQTLVNKLQQQLAAKEAHIRMMEEKHAEIGRSLALVSHLPLNQSLSFSDGPNPPLVPTADPLNLSSSVPLTLPPPPVYSSSSLPSSTSSTAVDRAKKFMMQRQGTIPTDHDDDLIPSSLPVEGERRPGTAPEEVDDEALEAEKKAESDEEPHLRAPQGEDDDEDELPAGWSSAKDPRTGRVFYIDHVNKKTQWTSPLYAKVSTTAAAAASTATATPAATTPATTTAAATPAATVTPAAAPVAAPAPAPATQDSILQGADQLQKMIDGMKRTQMLRLAAQVEDDDEEAQNKKPKQSPKAKEAKAAETKAAESTTEPAPAPAPAPTSARKSGASPPADDQVDHFGAPERASSGSGSDSDDAPPALPPFAHPAKGVGVGAAVEPVIYDKYRNQVPQLSPSPSSMAKKTAQPPTGSKPFARAYDSDDEEVQGAANQHPPAPVAVPEDPDDPVEESRSSPAVVDDDDSRIYPNSPDLQSPRDDHDPRSPRRGPHVAPRQMSAEERDKNLSPQLLSIQSGYELDALLVRPNKDEQLLQQKLGVDSPVGQPFKFNGQAPTPLHLDHDPQSPERSIADSVSMADESGARTPNRGDALAFAMASSPSKNELYGKSVEHTDDAVMEMLKMLALGSWLVKHGRQGKPKKRFINITKQGKLFWNKVGRTASNTTATTFVILSQVTDLRKGKFTKVFQRSTAKGVSDNVCLSIITKQRSLDLQFPAAEERDKWVIALRVAVERAKQVAHEQWLKSQRNTSETFRNIADPIAKQALRPSLRNPTAVLPPARGYQVPAAGPRNARSQSMTGSVSERDEWGSVSSMPSTYSVPDKLDAPGLRRGMSLSVLPEAAGGYLEMPPAARATLRQQKSQPASPTNGSSHPNWGTVNNSSNSDESSQNGRQQRPRIADVFS